MRLGFVQFMDWLEMCCKRMDVSHIERGSKLAWLCNKKMSCVSCGKTLLNISESLLNKKLVKIYLRMLLLIFKEPANYLWFVW